MKKYIYFALCCFFLLLSLIPDAWSVSVLDRRFVTIGNIRSIIFTVGPGLLLLLFILSLAKKVSWRWVLSILYFLTSVAISGQVYDCLRTLNSEFSIGSFFYSLASLSSLVFAFWCLFPSSKRYLKKIFIFWLSMLTLVIVITIYYGPQGFCHYTETYPSAMGRVIGTK